MCRSSAAISDCRLSICNQAWARRHDDCGSPGQIGRLLLQNFLLPFEAASYLLLVAAVGAVVLARRRRGLEVGGALEEGGT